MRYLVLPLLVLAAGHAAAQSVTRASLLVLLVLGACQPRAGRLLLVDFSLSEPVTLEQTAAPWRAAGYDVEYRRFYPHLTRADLARYGTVILLGGAEPEYPSDALTVGDLAILTEWVTHQAGGVVVFGYGSGGLDRWVINRWLGFLGTGIAIESQPLQDTVRGPTAVPQPRSALDNAGFAPFAAGISHGLRVRHARQALARAPATVFVRQTGGVAAARARVPVIAASRGRHGLVVVASRQTLAAGDDAGAGAFLETLARWTRRPAEWAGIATASEPALLAVRGAPRAVAADPPPGAPPPRAVVVALPLRRPQGPPPEPRSMPTWISRHGMRVLWTDVPPRPSRVDSVLGFADGAALNALATEVPLEALAESLPPMTRGGLRSPWQAFAERMQTTSFRWFPAIRFDDLPVELAVSQVRRRFRTAADMEPVTVADEVDRHGELAALPCGLDSLFWRGALRPALRALARLGGARGDVITGIALDLQPAADRYAVMGFCEADWREGLAGLELDSLERSRLAALPPVARYDTLLQRGLLDGYYGALEAAVSARAATLRAELRRLHPDLRFAVRADRAPLDWFSLGIMRGFSTPDVPLYLWTAEREVSALLRSYGDRGIMAVSAVRVVPRGTTSADWQRLRPLVFTEHDGFWLPAAGADTVGRLIRRFVK